MSDCPDWPLGNPRGRRPDQPEGFYDDLVIVVSGADLHRDERIRPGATEWGVAAICIGVGQGLAVVLENVAAKGTRS